MSEKKIEKKFDIIPLGENVLIEMTMTKKKSAILIPTAADGQPNPDQFDTETVVLAVGPDCKLDIKKGDVIITDKHITMKNQIVTHKEENKKVVMEVLCSSYDIIGIIKYT